MNVFVCFVCFGAGVALDATYNYYRRRAEQKACNNGYQQGKREEQIRREADERVHFYEWLYKPIPTPQKNDNIIIPDKFMDDLHNNGRAAMRIK